MGAINPIKRPASDEQIARYIKQWLKEREVYQEYHKKLDLEVKKDRKK
jgi:hypothetical protein